MATRQTEIIVVPPPSLQRGGMRWGAFLAFISKSHPLSISPSKKGERNDEYELTAMRSSYSLLQAGCLF
jgi:hypothetical protein